MLVFDFPWATKQTTNFWLSQEFAIFSIAAEFIQTNYLSYTDSKLMIYLIKKVHKNYTVYYTDLSRSYSITTVRQYLVAKG